MKSKILKILAIPVVGFTLVASSAASQSDLYSGKSASSDKISVPYQHSGRWIDHRASIKRSTMEQSEMAVMEIRENDTLAGKSEKREPSSWQGRRHDSRRY